MWLFRWMHNVTLLNANTEPTERLDMTKGVIPLTARVVLEDQIRPQQSLQAGLRIGGSSLFRQSYPFEGQGDGFKAYSTYASESFSSSSPFHQRQCHNHHQCISTPPSAILTRSDGGITTTGAIISHMQNTEVATTNTPETTAPQQTET